MTAGLRQRVGIVLIVVGVGALAIAAIGVAQDGDQPDRATPPTTQAAPTTQVRSVTAEEVVAFVGDLTRAIAEKNTTYLLERLDPVVTGTYGTEACANHARGLRPGPTNPTDPEGPAPYVWSVDGISITVPDVWSVHVTGGSVHVGTRAGRPTWFTDCGTPLPEGERQQPSYAKGP